MMIIACLFVIVDYCLFLLISYYAIIALRYFADDDMLYRRQFRCHVVSPLIFSPPAALCALMPILFTRDDMALL